PKNQIKTNNSIVLLLLPKTYFILRILVAYPRRGGVTATQIKWQPAYLRDVLGMSWGDIETGQVASSKL
ncbi:MAG: hypothetical protein AB4042_19775, partial [Leptolyngbyaceae cyanobacterium]